MALTHRRGRGSHRWVPTHPTAILVVGPWSQGLGTPIPWGGGPNPSHGYIGRGTMVPGSGDPHPMGPPAGMTTFGTPFGHVPTIFDAGSIGIPDLGPPKRGPGTPILGPPFWDPLFERFWPVRPKPSKSLCSP